MKIQQNLYTSINSSQKIKQYLGTSYLLQPIEIAVIKNNYESLEWSKVHDSEKLSNNY